MVDIHSHIVFGVDDGSKSLNQSIKYLDQLKKIGLKRVICTPHSKGGNIDKIVKVNENYSKLVKEAKKRGIELFLGNEILYSEKTIRLLERNRLRTLNDSDYILLEFKRSERMEIEHIIDILESLKEKGYKVILAHPELYVNYRNIENMYRIKDTGTLLQMDATSILRNKTNKKTYKFSKKLLEEKLIDIVASDSHCTKKRSYLPFKKAYKKIKRKYGKIYADILFKKNPSLLIGGTV